MQPVYIYAWTVFDLRPGESILKLCYLCTAEAAAIMNSDLFADPPLFFLLFIDRKCKITASILEDPFIRFPFPVSSSSVTLHVD